MLLTKSNTKILKSLNIGYETYGLHLSPFTLNSLGKNVCPFATKECAESCLNTAGRGKFDKTQQARIRKTDWFLKNRTEFLKQLKRELDNIEKKRVKNNLNIAIRLNLTSDLSWETFIIDDKNIIEHYPNFMFYDYTKNPNRRNWNNYHLTFSFSGHNWEECEKKLNEGQNVSVVFNLSKKDKLPEYYKGYKVVNGDEHDLRFLDSFQRDTEKGLIVGLVYKKPKNKIDLKDNKFVVNGNS